MEKNKKAPRCRDALSCGNYSNWLAGAGGRGIDVYTAAAAVEFHVAIDEGENGVVAAEADVAAGEEFGAALADDDIAGNDGLAAEFLYAEPLADAIAAVLDAALTFFMSHMLGRLLR